MKETKAIVRKNPEAKPSSSKNFVRTNLVRTNPRTRSSSSNKRRPSGHSVLLFQKDEAHRASL